MNIFNGRLDLQSVTPVPDMPSQWDIVASFVDATGTFFATDTIVGDIIYNDVSSMNMGVSRYAVVSIAEWTDFGTLYARVEWAFPMSDAYPYTEPYCGFEAMIGRQLLGTVFLPSYSMQGMTENFIQYARNMEAWLGSRYSYINRVYDAVYVGALDGTNQTFTLVDSFISDTLEVKFCGLSLRKGVDYIVEGQAVILDMIPTMDDNLVIDMNKL